MDDLLMEVKKKATGNERMLEGAKYIFVGAHPVDKEGVVWRKWVKRENYKALPEEPGSVYALGEMQDMERRSRAGAIILTPEEIQLWFRA